MRPVVAQVVPAQVAVARAAVVAVAVAAVAIVRSKTSQEAHHALPAVLPSQAALLVRDVVRSRQVQLRVHADLLRVNLRPVDAG